MNANVLVRRLAAVALCVLVPSLAHAQAQAWPSRQVRLVIPFAAGAGTDVVARTVSNKAAELLGQPIVAENRAGANGNLGAEAAAKSPADGYTIAILSTIHAANQSFFRKLGYGMANDFVPVVELGVSPTVWVVRADLPVDGIDALAKYAKANPGKLTYGSGGAQHPAELFKALTGADITVVPYKGVSAALQDLLAGRVDMTVAGLLDTSAHIKAGKLRALATTNTTRLPQFPDAPAMAEGLPGYDFTLWYGLFAPTGTPAEPQARLRAAVLAALQSPDVLARFEALSLRTAKSSQAEFGARVRAEIARWSDTVKKAKIELQD
jgi:tripartite-type tricarboxylate transporter receptor subunit TctC